MKTQFVKRLYALSESRQITYPCKCEESRCSCCSGNILQNFNFNLRQRLCTNITYNADDFEFNVRILFSDYTIYNRVVSGTKENKNNSFAVAELKTRITVIIIKSGNCDPNAGLPLGRHISTKNHLFLKITLSHLFVQKFTRAHFFFTVDNMSNVLHTV